MPDQADIDSRIARIEAALSAAMAAVAAQADAQANAPDHSAALKAAEAELLVARQRIVTLESEAKERETTLGAALERADAAEAAPAAPVAPPVDVSALETQIEELKAARAMDLAEMKALLAELEPMLEAANA